MEDDPLIMHIALRSDLAALGWNQGSIVAQACHASTGVIAENLQEPNTIAYLQNVDSMRKVVVEVHRSPID